MWFLVPYLATALALLGNFFLARKNRLGWFLHIFATLTWMCYALIGVGQIHLAIACGIYLPLEIYGIINWKRTDE